MIRGVGVSFLLLATAMAAPILVGALAGQLQPALGFDDAGLGLAVSVFWAGTAVMAVLGGRFAERVGWRMAAGVGAFLAAIALVTMAVFVRSYPALLATMVVFSVVYGVCSPTSNLAVTRQVPQRLVGLAFGLKQAAPPVVSVLAGFSLPLIALRFGWYWAFAAAALVLLPLLVLLILRPARTPSADASTAVARPGATLRLRPLFLANALGAVAIGALSTFSVRTMIAVGMEPAIAGGVLAAAGACSLAFRLMSAWYLKNADPRDLRVVLVLVALSVLCFALMAIPHPIAVALGVILGNIAAWTWPPLLLFVIIQSSDRPAAISGKVMVGSGLGNSLGPVSFGLVVSTLSFTVSWVIMAALTLLSLGLILRARGSGAGSRPAR